MVSTNFSLLQPQPTKFLYIAVILVASSLSILLCSRNITTIFDLSSSKKQETSKTSSSSEEVSKPSISFSFHHVPIEELPLEYGAFRSKCKKLYSAPLKIRRRRGINGIRDWSTTAAALGSNNKVPLNESGILDFTVSFQTEFNFLVMGDSIGQQMYDWIGHASSSGSSSSHRGSSSMMASNHTPNTTTLAPATHGQTQADQESKGSRISTLGSGNQLAYLHCRGFLTEDHHRPVKNKGYIWNKADAEFLVNQSATTAATTTKNRKDDKEDSVKRMHSFDICIHRIAVPHIGSSQITTERLIESVNTTRRYFNCRVLFLVTVPWHNNLFDNSLIAQQVEKNNLIRNHVRDMRGRYNGTGFVLDYLDFDLFTQKLIQDNAERLGILPNETYSLRLEGSHWKAVQALLCREKLSPSAAYCQPNYLCQDGIHYCAEMLTARFNAGLACTIQCLFDIDDHFFSLLSLTVIACRDQCEEDYFSLKPIPLRVRWNRTL